VIPRTAARRFLRLTGLVANAAQSRPGDPRPISCRHGTWPAQSALVCHQVDAGVARQTDGLAIAQSAQEKPRHEAGASYQMKSARKWERTDCQGCDRIGWREAARRQRCSPRRARSARLHQGRRATADRIDLSVMKANSSAPGNQALHLVTHFTAATAVMSATVRATLFRKARREAMKTVAANPERRCLCIATPAVAQIPPIAKRAIGGT
jgi:hypothetical protein